MSERKREFEEEEASSTNVSPLKTTKHDDSDSSSDSHDVVVGGSSSSVVSLEDLASDECPVNSTVEENEQSSGISSGCFSSESTGIAKICSTFTVDLEARQISVSKTKISALISINFREETSQVSEEGLRESSSATERREVSKTPPPEEIERFFSKLENKDKQNQFMQKYNFDIVNDKPLEGRYKWDRLKP